MDGHLLVEGFVLPPDGPDFGAARERVGSLSADELLRDHWDEEYGSDARVMRRSLLDALDIVESSYRDESQSAGKGYFPSRDGHVVLLHTGGLSYGDSPTDEFDSFALVTGCGPVMDALLRRDQHAEASPLPRSAMPTTHHGGTSADATALDLIATALDGAEWSAETVDVVATIARGTGRQVRDPNGAHRAGCDCPDCFRGVNGYHPRATHPRSRTDAMADHITLSDLQEAARALRSEHGENREYDRALDEIVRWFELRGRHDHG